jgi:hypothetical protein
VRVSPPPARELAVPAQQRRRCHHESVQAPVREKSSERSDERTIGGPKLRALLLASQNRELVPQQHQFHVLGELGPSTPNEQSQNSSEGKVSEGEEHRPDTASRANALTADSSCALQPLLVFARARETNTQDAAAKHSGRSRDP